jgi:malate dehydrogenase (oxaloacetate-decarboxylating)
VLAFPGIFRGLLNANAKQVTEEVEIAAARAIAGVVTDAELSADYIVPTVFNPNVVSAVTNAVEKIVAPARH